MNKEIIFEIAIIVDRKCGQENGPGSEWLSEFAKEMDKSYNELNDKKAAINIAKTASLLGWPLNFLAKTIVEGGGKLPALSEQDCIEVAICLPFSKKAIRSCFPIK